MSNHNDYEKSEIHTDSYSHAKTISIGTGQKNKNNSILNNTAKES